MTDDEVHSAVVRWVKATTGSPLVIKADQSGDLPATPYIMVRLTGTSEVRRHAQKIEYEDLGISVGVRAFPVLEIEWRFSLHAYGSDPTTALRPIRSAFQLAQCNEMLVPNLTIFEISQIRSLPEYINEGWEPRAQMDFFIRGLTRDGLLIDTIESYSFEFERQDGV